MTEMLPDAPLELRVKKDSVSSFGFLKMRHLLKKGGDERQPQGNLRKQRTVVYTGC